MSTVTRRSNPDHPPTNNPVGFCSRSSGALQEHRGDTYLPILYEVPSNIYNPFSSGNIRGVLILTAVLIDSLLIDSSQVKVKFILFYSISSICIPIHHDGCSSKQES